MNNITEESFESCGFFYTLSLINGKYKMPVLYTLANFGTVRFNETLSVTLKELEKADLIHRKEYPQIPPKVEYSLTERSKTLIPVLEMMCDWGESNRA